MNGEVKTELKWPARSGPCDAENATGLNIDASTASRNGAVITDSSSNISSSHDVISDGAEMVNGIQNGGMAANSPPTSACTDDVDYVPTGVYAVSSQLASHKKALPKLSCDTPPCIPTDLPTIKEHSPYHMTPPSSPMLTAVRDAVSSLNRMEDFEIIEEIGEGFYAKVYKVRDPNNGQIMVLKLNMKATGAKTLKEVELLKKLSHPNIVQYLGAIVHDAQLHPLMEYANGGSMESLLHNYKLDLSWCLRINLAFDVSRGMQYLHSNGMLHRDLNSRNVLLRHKGSHYTAVVADFGLATKTRNPKQKYKKSLSIVGTAYWGAPELLSGKPYDEKADVFSYGIVLCEIMSRKTADPDEIPRTQDFGLDCDKFRNVIYGADCPESFLQLAYQCCKVNTDERFLFPAIVQEVSSILEAFSDTGSMELVQCEVTPLPLHPKLSRKKSGNLMVLPLPRLRRLMSEETPV